MNQSRISFLYKLTNLLIFLTSIYLHIYLFIPNVYILYLIPLLSFVFLIDRKKKFYLLLSILVLIFTFITIFYLNKPVTFINLIKDISLFLLYLIFFNFVNSNFCDSISIPILILYLILFEKFRTTNILLMVLSSFLIILSIFLKYLITKGLYFWENDFYIKGKPYNRSFKYLLLSLVFFPIFYFLTFLRLPDLSKFLIFKPNTPSNSVDKINENVPKDIPITITKSLFTLKLNTQKFINIILNSLYIILFVGFFILFIFIGVILYRLVKSVYGKDKARNFLIYSFSITIGFLVLLYFLYKPFEKLIYYLRDKLISKNPKLIETIFERVQEAVRQLVSQKVYTKISNISIDIGAILIVILLTIVTIVTLYFIIYYLYKFAFNERNVELNKIIEGLRESEEKFYDFVGSPKEKIIALYNNLIDKLNIVLTKFIYETPIEFSKRFKNEEPNLSNEFDLITENFIIAKYSNENIDESAFKETFINYKKIIEKLFKEVYLGRQI